MFKHQSQTLASEFLELHHILKQNSLCGLRHGSPYLHSLKLQSFIPLAMIDCLEPRFPKAAAWLVLCAVVLWRLDTYIRCRTERNIKAYQTFIMQFVYA